MTAVLENRARLEWWGYANGGAGALARALGVLHSRTAPCCPREGARASMSKTVERWTLPRPHLRAESRTGLLFFAGFVAVIVAGLRFWNLGDLSLTSKIIESLAWFFSVFIGLGAIGLFIQTGLSDVAVASPRSSSGAISSVAPEDLTSIEAELPEMAPSENEGLKGETPEELANVLKKISEGG